MGELALDGCLVSSLFPLLGLGKSPAPMRRRGDPEFYRYLVGKSPAALEPGRQLARSRTLLDPRRWLAAHDGALSHRRNGLYVGRALPALGTPALNLSRGAAIGPALDFASSRLRQTRSGSASRNRGRSSDRFSLFVRGDQYELRLP